VVISGYAHIRAALSDHLPLSIFPSQAKSPVSSPFSNHPFINNINHHPSRQTTLFLSPAAVNPYRHPAASEVQGCSMSRTATKGRWNTLYILSDQMDAFSIQALSVLSLTVLGSAASFLSLFVTFEMTFRYLFYYLPFSLLPRPPPFHAHSVCILPSWSRIYAPTITHLTRYMIHVQASLFFHLTPLILPNVLFSFCSDSVTTASPPRLGSHCWDRRGLRVACGVVARVACV